MYTQTREELLILGEHGVGVLGRNEGDWEQPEAFSARTDQG